MKMFPVFYSDSHNLELTFKALNIIHLSMSAFVEYG